LSPSPADKGREIHSENKKKREREGGRKQRLTHGEHNIGARRIVGVNPVGILNLWLSDGGLSREECQVVDIIRGHLSHIVSLSTACLCFIDITGDGINIVVAIDRDWSEKSQSQG
jgi:hypothetical protein